MLSHVHAKRSVFIDFALIIPHPPPSPQFKVMHLPHLFRTRIRTSFQGVSVKKTLIIGWFFLDIPQIRNHTGYTSY